jgi:hypothetical protein
MLLPQEASEDGTVLGKGHPTQQLCSMSQLQVLVLWKCHFLFYFIKTAATEKKKRKKEKT